MAFVVLVEGPIEGVAGVFADAGLSADEVGAEAAVLQILPEVVAITRIAAAGFGDGVAQGHDPGEGLVTEADGVEGARIIACLEDDVEIVEADGAIDVRMLGVEGAGTAGDLSLEGADQRAGGAVEMEFDIARSRADWNGKVGVDRLHARLVTEVEVGERE